jgi:hypothetical protein
MSNIKLVDTLAAKIAEGLKVENNHIEAPVDIYEANLPENVSPEQAAAVNEYNVNFQAATGIATGLVMQANPEVKSISSAFATSGGVLTMEHTVDREVVIAGETKPNYLVSAASYSVSGDNDVLAHAVTTVAALEIESVDELESDD